MKNYIEKAQEDHFSLCKEKQSTSIRLLDSDQEGVAGGNPHMQSVCAVILTCVR